MAASDNDNSWQLKYRNATQEHEADRQRWVSMDALQRRLIGRLCAAARGLDGRLDGELERLTAALSRPHSFEQLGPLAESVSRAVALLPDRGVARSSTPAPIGPAALPAEVLELVVFSPAQQPRAQSLRERLARGDASGAAEEFAELIALDRAALRNEKVAAERLLEQVTARLDEMAGYLQRESQNRQAAAASGQRLDSDLRGEMQAIDDSVRAAVSLSSLQDQVRRRLELIGEHLRSYQEREAQRRQQHEADASRMRSRIEELERGAQALRQSAEEGQKLALTDALTGAPNRLAYEHRIQQVFADAGAGTPVLLAVWDIDHFKRINDRYGHPAGDKLLRVVAQLLLRNVRSSDFVARIGGEEFVMLLTGTGRHEALARADQLRRTVEGAGFAARGERISVTVSCGLAELVAGDTPESLFERADRALYQAKHQGRNRCILA
ncbi:diguanylate cyclase [Fontimonas sp. SYSU GA230001]|uniref:GGDEF domain-containing protein n=1 Tax=Fontimonas sp. SYSU GA230001 TaxID=3142450 RepID=UPI0032B4D0D8